jgi:uncharacterized membrane protein YccC
MTETSSSLSPASLCARCVTATRAFVSPGPRMVDELECAASVLLAIGFGHLAGAQNISWAAFSGYMVMRGHVSESLTRGIRRIVGTALGAGVALALTPLAAANPALAALALALVGGVTLYGALVGRHAYAWLFVGLTFAMILLDKLARPQDALDAFARTRILEVVAGTTACLLVSMVSTHSLRRRWPGPPGPEPQRFGWRPEAARHAGQAAAALFLLPFLGQLWRGPDLAQSAVTVMAVMLVPVSGIGASGLAPVSRRILLRVAGCTAGAALAAALLFLAHSPPLAGAAAPVLIAGTVLGVAIGRHIENSQTSIAYGGTQFVLAILVTLVPDSYATAHIGPALERLGGIVVGIALLEPVLVAWRLVAPARRSRARAAEEPAEPGGV